MSYDERYKVLWIEDDPGVVASYTATASEVGIDLVQYTDWESASKFMDQYFDEIDAIIFDAHCKIKEGDTVANDAFLHIAVVEMLLKFAKFHSVRPWYILSAGTMNRFTDVTSIIASYRREYDEEWGELIYTKTNPEAFANEFADPIEAVDKPANETDLLNQIINVCSAHVHNIALARHRDTLQYLGSHALIKGNARNFLLQLLGALYEPQKYVGFRFYGNPIRRIFECLVNSGVELGIIPPEAMPGGNVKCMEASRFLCGENPVDLPYRYGFSNERILDTAESSMLISVLTSTNVGSHESSIDYAENDVTLGDDNRDEYAGCALFMCRIIKAFGQYAHNHSLKEENMSKWCPNPNLLEGKEYVIESIGDILYAGDCLLPDKPWLSVGNKVILRDIVFNSSESSETFPFYCKNPQTPRARK